MADAAVSGRTPPPPPPAAAVDTERRGVVELAGQAIVPMSVLLVPSGCLFLWVGAVDIGTAESLPSNLFGAILALVGCGLLTTSFGVWGRRPWAGTAGVVALLAAAAVALWLSLNAWEEEGSWGLVFAVVAAACALVLVAIVAAYRPRFGVKSASILSVAGFVFGFFQFTYAQSAQVRVGSTLTMSTDLSPAGGEHVKTLAATVKAVNPTTAKIQSLGSLYVVEGIRHCRGKRAEGAHKQFGRVFEQTGAAAAFAPRVTEQDVVTIQAGKVFDDRTYFEPGEEIVRRFSIPIPRGKFDLVRLRVIAAVANGDRLQLGEVVRGPAALDPETGGARGVGVLYRVSEGSLVDRVTRGDRVVEVVWESGRTEVRPALWASARLARAGADADRGTAYGLAYTGSTTELPLERAKTTRRHEAREGAAERAAMFWPPPRVGDGELPMPTPAPTPPQTVTPPTPTPKPRGTIRAAPSPPAIPAPPAYTPAVVPAPSATDPDRPKARKGGGRRGGDHGIMAVESSCEAG